MVKDNEQDSAEHPMSWESLGTIAVTCNMLALEYADNNAIGDWARIESSISKGSFAASDAGEAAHADQLIKIRLGPQGNPALQPSADASARQRDAFFSELDNQHHEILAVEARLEDTLDLISEFLSIQ